jgi:hypothetical protein
MYSLVINLQKKNFNFFINCKIKKIWTFGSGSVFSFEKRIHHRAKVYEPSIEHWDGQKFYSSYNIFYKVNKTNDLTETSIDSGTHSIRNFPSIFYSNGTKEWHVFGVLHRLDGPAVVYPNGDCEYWELGCRHRLDGPAVIYGNKQYWFEKGRFIQMNIN